MAYQYEKWPEQPTIREQYDMLSKHLGEVAARMRNEMSSADQSTSAYALQRYHKTLLDAYQHLKEAIAVEDMPHGGQGRMIFVP